MARITGIGGIFFKSPDPKALAAWYREKLGLAVENWGGALLTTGKDSPPKAVWSPFKADTTYFAPSTKDFMVNFAVDDMDGFCAMLTTNGVAILKRDDSDPSGKFAWVMDLDGNKVELWQPTS